MTDAAVNIESDQLLEDVEHHFRVQAGPGAGKTHWLVGHIKNALHRSKRLTPASRIACISYTNVAVDEIRERLGPAADRVDVSTIHSFLYRNVVKPYLHRVTDSHDKPLVDVARVDGHDEHRPSYQKVNDWIQHVSEPKLRRFFQSNRSGLFDQLRKTAFQLAPGGGRWVIRDSRFPSLSALSSEQIQLYKTQYWAEGTIDHEDVLYFAHRILEGYPFIRTFLTARFPYIFVDEFQDTNPVQTQVVKWLAETGSVVGVIGDAEQAIYGFQGARRQDFVDFSLQGLRNYEISDNRRSTGAIVDLLNRVRTDGLTQRPLRQVADEPVRVLVGDVTKTLHHARTILNGSELHVLARMNKDVAHLRTETGTPTKDAWERFEQVDSDRARFFQHLMRGVEAARLKNFTLALRELLTGIRLQKGKVDKPLKCTNTITALQRRAIAVSLLEHILRDYGNIAPLTLLHVYNRVSKALRSFLPGLSLTGVLSGKGFDTFARSVRYETLASAVRVSDETRTVRTMHSAKGAGFANVLVCLGDGQSSRLDHILDPGDSDDEERRVTYVAISRAQDRLFLSVPAPTASEEDRLRNLSVQVIRVP